MRSFCSARPRLFIWLFAVMALTALAAVTGAVRAQAPLNPRTISFNDETGKYTVRLTFPYGEGRDYEVGLPDIRDTMVKVQIVRLDPYQRDTKV